MKKLLFTCIMLLVASFSWAQQIAAYGGLSMPLGSYKGDIGRAEPGYHAGIAIDHHFKAGKWGLGIDGRFLNHNIRKFDSVFFSNGYIAANYDNHPSFQHVGLSIGPSYKNSLGSLDLEAFLRGGVLFQGFPEYQQSVYINQAVGPALRLFDNQYTDNPKRISKALMGLGGFRLSYRLNANWAVFLQADYLRSFGKSFAGDSSEFHVLRYQEKKAITAADVFAVKDDRLTNLSDFYEEVPLSQKTFVQAVDVAAGIRFSFGRQSKKPKEAVSNVVKSPISPINTAPKDILVVVKDKQTGLPLGGVKVVISRAGQEEISLSNANGEADKVRAAQRGKYEISALKNGIAAEKVLIMERDFDKSGSLIYKEIYHDDPRFTLIGETIRANDNAKLPGISTVLTNTASNKNMSQISDAEAKFVYQLEQAADYQVVANQSGKFSQTEDISTKGLDRSKTLYVTLKLGISNLDAGAVFVLKNIHYDFDQSFIRPDAKRILDNVWNVMQQNPSLRIELSSHTDSRGKDAYNMVLSQKRAEAAVDYLVSKGISRDRMKAKGYGESRLLNKCGNGIECDEAIHQENRRTEIKVLKY